MAALRHTVGLAGRRWRRYKFVIDCEPDTLNLIGGGRSRGANRALSKVSQLNKRYGFATGQQVTTIKPSVQANQNDRLGRLKAIVIVVQQVPHLVERLFAEASLLADEARSYFDGYGRLEREALDPAVRVEFSCESLKVTTRLLHVFAWLLTQRAIEADQLTPEHGLDPIRRVADVAVSDMDIALRMPRKARPLIRDSIDLHRRVATIDANLHKTSTTGSVRQMQQALLYDFGSIG